MHAPESLPRGPGACGNAASPTLRQDADLVAHCNDAAFTLAFARIECHYFVNRGFFESDTQLVDGMSRLRDIPGFIVHGRYDVICPPRNAWRLHRAWPESTLVYVEAAGHSANEPGIVGRTGRRHRRLRRPLKPPGPARPGRARSKPPRGGPGVSRAVTGWSR
jgi:pimeloyl-ACP methyl ester carboxylesterase